MVPEVDIHIIALLILSGLFVGVVNTFAGAAAALTLALFTALGMDVNTANGTNRIPVVMQTAVMSVGFRRQGFLDLRVGLRVGIPAVIGAIVGSLFAVQIPPSVFQILLGTMLIILLFILLFDPKKFLNSKKTEHTLPKTSTYLWFLLIGLYGGFFHVGVGYFILTASILSMGHNLMEANALKGFVVFMYIPFSLLIFALNDQVVYQYGLIHGCGNIVGSWYATRNSKKIPLNLIRWLLVAMILLTVADLFEIIDLTGSLEIMFRNLIK